MISRHLQSEFCGSNLKRAITKKVLAVCLVLITATAIDAVALAQKAEKTLTQEVLVGREVTSFRLVEIIDEKPTRFSKLVKVEHGEQQQLHYHDLEMTNAISLTGTLVDEVQQPVPYGRVTGGVVSIGESGNAPAKGEHAWCWLSQARVKPDGSFVLNGIPTDCILQIVASSNGWSNKPLGVEEIRENFPHALGGDHSVLPQLVHIGEQDIDVTVAMQPLGRVTVNVVDSEKRPIADAKVSYSSVQTFLYSGKSGLFVYGSSSARRLLGLRDRFIGWRDWRTTHFIDFLSSERSTDQTGTIATRDLPAGRTSIHVLCPVGYLGAKLNRSKKI